MDLERIALSHEPTDLEDDYYEWNRDNDDSESRYFLKVKGEVTIEKVETLKLVYEELALSALKGKVAEHAKEAAGSEAEDDWETEEDG